MINKILANVGNEIVKDIGDTIDKISTSNEEKLLAKNTLTDIVLSNLNSLLKTQEIVLSNELSGNFLQRSWRPILMLSFGFIVISNYFILPIANIWIGNENLNALIFELRDNDNFWELLNIGIGGYVIGRTIEKVGENVTKNIDISQIRRRDRKLE